MSIHKEFSANSAGRDFVVGDIHGMYDEFMELLNSVDFDKKKDRCFSVGDLVDRGPKSDECFELIYEKWFFPVRGNHEQLMVDAYGSGSYDLWLYNGGGWDDHWDQSLRKYNLERIADLPLAITVNLPGGARVGICHAEPPVEDWNDIENLDERQQQITLWSRSAITLGAPIVTDNITATVHGHTILAEPAQLGNAFFIDTGSFATRKITILNLQECFS